MKASLTVTVFSILAAIVTADNAALTSGGLPTMLKAHKSVAMESEIVKMTIHWNRVDVDCSFVFVNHGPACKVNMGFPDFGMWAYEYARDKPETMFKAYQSFVDGKPVKTKLVLGKKPGEQWQTKTVTFSKNGRRIVREVYTTQFGGAAISRTEFWGFASYLLHTGASWNGNIGKATVMATVDPDTDIALPLDALYVDHGHDDSKAVAAHMKKPGGVVVSGMSRPTVNGRTLTFVRQNWKPTEADDILIGFRYSDKVVDRLRKGGG